MTRKSIVLVGPLPPPVHGAGRVTEGVLNELRSAALAGDIDVTAVSTSVRSGRSQIAYHIARLGKHGRAAAAVARARCRGRGVLYVGGAGGGGLWYQSGLVALARMVCTRVVFHHHAYSYLVGTPSLAMRAIVLATGRSDTHVCLSRSMTDLFLSRYRPRAQVLTVSNAWFVDSRQGSRGPSGTAYRLVHVSNLSIEKGSVRVVKAFDLLRARELDVTLTLVGPVTDAAVRDAIDAASTQHGDRVIHLGQTDHEGVGRALDEADLFVFPTAYRHEAQPMVLLEAMARGVPVLASALGSIVDMVPPSWLIDDDDDDESLAHRVVEMMTGDWASQSSTARRQFEASLGFSDDLMCSLLDRTAQPLRAGVQGPWSTQQEKAADPDDVPDDANTVAPAGQPISVLHVLGMIGSHRGGSAAAALAIAVATRDGGDRVTILTTDDGAHSGEDLSALHALSDVEVVACRRQWPHHLSFSGPLVVWLWRNIGRFDLVEVHEIFAFPTLAVWAVARLRRVPFVVHPHGSLEPYDMRKHARIKDMLRPGLRRMLRGSAGVWLTAAREEANLAHLYGGFRTVVSPLPVPPPGYRGDCAAFRARYGLDEHDRVVLYLGRLDPKKGLPRLIAAFEAVRDDLDDVRLVIAGSGKPSFVDGLGQRLVASRHAGSIQLVGFLSGQRKADALTGANLFVLHSDNENFGIAPVEALRCGTPVLLSDEVYIADEIAAAGAADVVPVTGTAALAARLGALMSDPAKLRRLAARGAAATEPYLPERVARRDASIRRHLLAAHVTSTSATAR